MVGVERGDAGDLDLEIDLGVAIGVALHNKSIVVHEIVQLAGSSGEGMLADKMEGMTAAVR
jgi:hypothetical protein